MYVYGWMDREIKGPSNFCSMGRGMDKLSSACVMLRSCVRFCC
jgi:hypothetical protein